MRNRQTKDTAAAGAPSDNLRWRAWRVPIVLSLLLVASFGVLPCGAGAAQPASDVSHLDEQLGDSYRYIGQIQPRHARDIAASNWSIGAETMDRDFTIYANWREHLGPLGAKKARIQSGWAKTETKRGVYDWAWVDEIVLDMVDQGVEPWVCLCYGNPVYPGGGDTGLGGGLVSSEEALQAWERYVTAFVTRYAEHVDAWELWNEPRTGRGEGAVQYAKFVIRTAQAIRKLQPDAEIMFAAGGSFDTTFAKEVLEFLRKEDKLDLVDTIIYHPYRYNPDEPYGAIGELRRIAKSFASYIDIRQGENGAPSRPGGFGAIAKNDWTERSQAKWALRRLLGDLGRDIPSSYFAICDMKYPDRVNFKGLLAINDDQTVHHRKLGYFAVQHVTSLFDDTIKRDKDFKAQLTGGDKASRFSVFGYRGAGQGSLVTMWRSSDTPGKRPEFERVDLTVEGHRFEAPVWIDLLTGRVYEIADTAWKTTGSGTAFTDLAVYDSVVVIADRNEVARVLAVAKPADGEGVSDGPVLEAIVTINSNVSLSGVALAVDDLTSDLEKVLGTAPRRVESDNADITIRLDETIGAAESYRIDVTREGTCITGADDLGVIYGIYRFSNQFLGVDPYWYFKDLAPQRRQRIRLVAGAIESEAPTFAYRGWFVNDEDLLTEWKDGGGVRHISYPYYRQVVQLDVLDRVFEALLRAGGNLIIPASFVDVMNEPEARLVQRAAERSLYVSQHHIEPLGVSHYGFENYWKAKGQEYPFAYGSHPERVREAWRAFAERWRALAGDKVIWQLGLRGKGDRAIWDSDKSVDRAKAGTLISQAIAEQWEIVRSVDPRPVPPATTTLWLEGSALMSEGRLTFPEDITIVFCDHGPSQRMQTDFYETPRSDKFGYGAYYHIGFWGTGPHLLQGSTPQRIRREFDLIVGKGDTDYAIINVCNVREHVLGIQAATEIMTDRDWSETAFWERFAPRVLHGPYQTLLSNLFPLDDGRIMQDGALFAAAKKMLARYATGERSHGVLATQTTAKRIEQLTTAITNLDALVAEYPVDELTANQRSFHDVHFLTQAQMLRELYASYRALIQAADDPSQLAEAEAALQRFLTVRENAATGKWAGWYRGDKKVNVPVLLEKTQAAQKQLAGLGDG